MGSLSNWGQNKLVCEAALRNWHGLGPVDAAFSYGISGADDFGSSARQKMNLSVYMYDCWHPAEPKDVKKLGRMRFRNECLGTQRTISQGRTYGAVEQHLREDAKLVSVLRWTTVASSGAATPS